MDDILERMLAVDEQAEKNINEAKQTAANISNDGRLKINILNDKAQQGLQKESEAYIHEKMDAMEKKCQEKRKQSEQKFIENGANFAKKIAPKKQDVVQVLAFPES